MKRDDGSDIAIKADRIAAMRQVAHARDRNRLDVSVLNHSDDGDVVSTVPALRVKMQLAAGYKTTQDYPPYSAANLAVNDDEGAAPEPHNQDPAPDQTDIVVKTVDFPIDSATFDQHTDLTATEVEAVVRNAAKKLTDGDVQLAALHYLDPQRFTLGVADPSLAGVYGTRITQENVTVSAREEVDESAISYAEDILPFTSSQRIDVALQNAGYDNQQCLAYADRIADALNGSELKAGTVLRVGLEVRGDTPRIVRISVYDGSRHLMTIASNDSGQLVQTDEPEPNPDVFTAFDDAPPIPERGTLPTYYDAIYQAALANGMSPGSTKRVLKVLSGNLELDSRVGRADQLDVLFTQPGDDEEMTEESRLLYVALTIDGKTRRFYRHQSANGSIDYFNQDGRSGQQSMLRIPVSGARLSSPFGAREHPILGISRAHTGVDWAAPSGTPIHVTGDGVVEKAGWASGYGRQTMVRHANGYESSYNHQSRIIVAVGQQVKQGQVIGYIGSTGLSTGPHLHYEVIVNGIKVDPMRVRLPDANALAGRELTQFKRDVQLIDQALATSAKDPLKVAQTQ